MDQPNQPDQTYAQDERFLSAIGYLGILCLVPLLLKKNSAYCQHHGKQGLVVLIVWCLLWVSNVVPVLGQIVWAIGAVMLVILMILGVVNASNGKMWTCPCLASMPSR
jgi:uncharacterized membrane protein